ncbi:MAG: TIGR00297 family protein [Archaeoglobaceae archaeon]
MLQPLVAAIALAAIPLDEGISFVFLVALTISYARKDNRLNFSEERWINYLFTSCVLGSAAFAVPKEVVYAAVFASLAHDVRGGLLRNLAAYFTLGFAYLSIANFASLADRVFVAISGAMAASLVESIETRADKRVATLLALATAYEVFSVYLPRTSLEELTFALAVSAIVSYAAMKAGVADKSGLLAAMLACTIVLLFSDIRHFVLLLLFFALGSAITKYKYDVKLQRGIAEQAGGARGYANVLGNSLPALFFAMNSSYGFTPAFVASVATALADTMASEVGKTADNVYLITNLKPVKPGESGGVSAIGELAALAGCALTAVTAYALGMVDLVEALAVVASSFVGVHVDSLLGATLEKKGYLTNSGVNLLGTLSGGLLCFALTTLT